MKNPTWRPTESGERFISTIREQGLANQNTLSYAEIECLERDLFMLNLAYARSFYLCPTRKYIVVDKSYMPIRPRLIDYIFNEAILSV